MQLLIKTKVTLPQAYVTLVNFGNSVEALSNTFNIFGFPILWIWVNLTKVIPDTRRKHYMRYLRFYHIMLFRVHPVIEQNLPLYLWLLTPIVLAFVGKCKLN